MHPKVAIIVLNWNGWKYTIECLESLYQITYPNYDVVVVDNGSEDQSIEKVKEYCEGKIEVTSEFFKYDRSNKPIRITEITREEARAGCGKGKEIIDSPSNKRLAIFKNEKNYGFSEGNNIGMEYAQEALKTDYILLLNNDVVVDPQFLTELVKIAEGDGKIGFVGPKIYYYDQRNTIYSSGASINFFFLHSKGGQGKVDKGQFDTVREVDALNGCALLLRSGLLESVGKLDPDYFKYYEETDWCIRAKKAGYRLIYAPKAIVFHKGAGTNTGPVVAYYKTRNLILFMRKNGRKIHWLTFIPYFTLLFVVRSLRAIWHRQPGVIWPMFRGLGWNIKNALSVGKAGWKH